MNELLNRLEELTDEKYDWLEDRKASCENDDEFFDIDRETDIWYTRKIAQLELAIVDLKTKTDENRIKR